MFRHKERHNSVLHDEKFNKQKRNSNYIHAEDEFYSADHLYYEEDRYQRFSDYSIVGDEYPLVGRSTLMPGKTLHMLREGHGPIR